MATESSDLKREGPGWCVDLTAWPDAKVVLTGGPSGEANFQAFLRALCWVYEKGEADGLKHKVRSHFIIKSLKVKIAFRVKELIKAIKPQKARIRKCVKGTVVTAPGAWFYLVAVVVGGLGGKTQAPYHAFKKTPVEDFREDEESTTSEEDTDTDTDTGSSEEEAREEVRKGRREKRLALAEAMADAADLEAAKKWFDALPERVGGEDIEVSAEDFEGEESSEEKASEGETSSEEEG